LDEVLTLEPNDTSALHNRAVAKSRFGDYQGAIEDETLSLRVDPKSFETLSSRGISKSILEIIRAFAAS
jgi:regulator of sirC expression with transglutaminase-like and TPR domain